MKKSTIIILVLVLICAIIALWCILNDPFSIRREDVASIDVYYYYDYRGADGDPLQHESSFTVTDENHIHYITDFLNNLLPIPGEEGYQAFTRKLTFRDHQGNVITEVTFHNNDSIITGRGTFQADVGELNHNLGNLEDGEGIVNSMMFLPLLLICWLVVLIAVLFVGAILFLIQMTVCYKTDSLSLRLLPAGAIVILCAGFSPHLLSSLYYWVSIIGFNSGDFGVILLVGAVVLSIVLGWRQGASARKSEGK